MEQLPTGLTGAIKRPAALTRLCIASFIDQGIMFPCYVLGIGVSAVMARMDPEAVDMMLRTEYSLFFKGDQLDEMLRYAQVLKEHGVLLMSVFALRTLVRFIGTLRMWRMEREGFHIYTAAQLIGVLLPMLVAGTAMFSALGLFIVLGWCYLYWSQMRALKFL